MGVLPELGYEVKQANALQRMMQRVAQVGPVSKVFQKTLYAIDRPLYRWTKSRVTVPGLGRACP